MHPLNPFLRAFFRSTLPAQCSPVQHHILLVPTTEVLYTSRDRETNSLYVDLVNTEEFLGSHVVRLPNGLAPGSGKDGDAGRDNRGKAKQFSTVNGRTVAIKDTFIYSNKGFKSLNQAQLLDDTLYYPDNSNPEPWLVYYISRPLLGAFEPISIIPAALPSGQTKTKSNTDSTTGKSSQPASIGLRKKDIKSFNELLNQFPMIARQMHPGLERLFKEFHSNFEKPLPPTPSQSTDLLRSASSPGQIALANGHLSPPLTVPVFSDDDEDLMRRALETAVTTAIDLFQLVDKQQLSLLGATTDLTGPVVEHLIEQYIVEQLHDSIIFPRLCSLKRNEDQELESRIRQMENIDVSQVGISFQGSQQAREELRLRLVKAVEEFRKMGIAGSPQEMLNILLATEKTLTSTVDTTEGNDIDDVPAAGSASKSEKPNHSFRSDADTLVSLLLVVVIRSQVRHLQARLTYMRQFIFIDDVEGGEMGYALSTFEAVLSYLFKDSAGLRKASKRNRKLWDAVKTGDVAQIRAILDPDSGPADIEMYKNGMVDEPEEIVTNTPRTLFVDDSDAEVISAGASLDDSDDDIAYDGSTKVGSQNGSIRGTFSAGTTDIDSQPEPSPLAHVFPFVIRRDSIDAPVERKKKRVSMDTRSFSSASSGYSSHSRATTIDSIVSSIEGDSSLEKLARSQDRSGESIPMMAVESKQPASLRYLLTLEDFYSLDTMLDDTNNEGTSLFSAAVQLGHTELIDIILDFVLQAEEKTVRSYFLRQDKRGRTVAHHLFNAPHLIERIGRLLPWKHKDKNGQTPLFALCRSYDHAHYRDMVFKALTMAQDAQQDNSPLHLDDHVDAKGNTLLHIVSDPPLARRILFDCDTDANATNDKRLTALMVASKYGRIDMVRLLFSDPRVDLYARDQRGLTAVEVGKDDEVRNRIDDLILFTTPPGEDGRRTAVVRSLFVEDNTIRLILKSGVPEEETVFSVTTCRRSLLDFESLAKWLAVEQPASWIPSISEFRSPFQIPTKPSRAVLREVQTRLDSFLRIMLVHPSFSTHEMLWEFFLVPEIHPHMMAERSQRIAEARIEKIKEEFEPIPDIRDVEVFVMTARDQLRTLQSATFRLIRRVNRLRNITTDLSTAHQLLNPHVTALTFVPSTTITSFIRYTVTVSPPSTPSNPYTNLLTSLYQQTSSLTALLISLSNLASQITHLSTKRKEIDRHAASARRADRWPAALGLLDETRERVRREAEARELKAREEVLLLERELSWSWGIVVGELAGWYSSRAKGAESRRMGQATTSTSNETPKKRRNVGQANGVAANGDLQTMPRTPDLASRRGTSRPASTPATAPATNAVKELARGMLVLEQARLESMRRAVRGVVTIRSEIADEDEESRRGRVRWREDRRVVVADETNA